MLGKVSCMANTTRTGVMWLSQTWLAVKCVRKEMMRKVTFFFVRKVFGLDRVGVAVDKLGLSCAKLSTA